MARPRKIEKEDALEAAMQAFWLNGFEATSMQDLMNTTGLKKGSIYQTFGGKKALFFETLTLYADRVYDEFRATFREAETPKDGMTTFLTEFLVNFALQETIRKGCFVVNTTIELAPHDEDARAIIQRQNSRIEKMLSDEIEKGQKTGEFRKDIPANELAIELNVMLYGLMADSKSTGDSVRTKKLAANFLRSLCP